MILYTEKQLEDAWHIHCAEIIYSNTESKIQLATPTLEEFRPIYEEMMEDIYNGGR